MSYLTLKVGAQVMFIKNDINGKYYNGKIGHVVALNDESIMVRCIGEDRLLRLILEFFSGTNASLTQLHRQTAAELKEKVTDVAMKWIYQIASCSYDQLNAPAFLERIKRSAEYFSANIRSSLSKAVELTPDVQSNNKQAMQRLKDTYSDLAHLYRFHRLLLDAIAENGFTASTYLKEKQHSLVIAIDGEQTPSRKKKERALKEKKPREKKPKEKKPKEEKEKTYVTSYKLFTSGMSIPDIAAARSLTVSSIFSHLAKYVETGQIQLKDIVPQDHITVIRRAIAAAGTDSGLTSVKALCPDDVTYQEISLIAKLDAGKV